jgi:hypothetical protein
MRSKKLPDAGPARKAMSHLPRDERLYRCPERQIGVWLPIPLSGRLDALTRIGEAAWAPTRRKEALSALLLAANPSSGALATLLERYRASKVQDAFVEGFDETMFLYPPGSPGPREQLRLWNDKREIPTPRLPTIAPDDELPAAEDFRIGMQVASPLAGRLKILQAIAQAGGARTSRRELIGAILLDAPTGGGELKRILDRYWHATVANALIEGEDAAVILDIPIRPRRRAGSSRARVPPKPANPTLRAPAGTRRSRKSVVPPPDT